MKKIILLTLTLCICVFAKNVKRDTFCEDSGIKLVQMLNDCVIDRANALADDIVMYKCANESQFVISKTGEFYFIKVICPDVGEFYAYYLTGTSTKQSFCVMEYYDELGVKTISGKTPMRYEHKFDVYDEFKKRFVNMLD